MLCIIYSYTAENSASNPLFCVLSHYKISCAKDVAVTSTAFSATGTDYVYANMNLVLTDRKRRKKQKQETPNCDHYVCKKRSERHNHPLIDLSGRRMSMYSFYMHCLNGCVCDCIFCNRTNFEFARHSFYALSTTCISWAYRNDGKKKQKT